MTLGSTSETYGGYIHEFLWGGVFKKLQDIPSVPDIFHIRKVSYDLVRVVIRKLVHSLKTVHPQHGAEKGLHVLVTSFTVEMSLECPHQSFVLNVLLVRIADFGGGGCILTYERDHFFFLFGELCFDVTCVVLIHVFSFEPGRVRKIKYVGTI